MLYTSPSKSSSSHRTGLVVACAPKGGVQELNRAPALTSFITLTRARARPWSARCYGVARHREGSRQNSRRDPR